MSASAPLTIPLQLTRRLAVARQLLAGPRPTPDAEGIMAVFDRLGCVQIDPIPVVDRTQYLVLFSRLGLYDRAEFDRLIYQERRLFEYWAHAASIVRTADLAVHKYSMARAFVEEPKAAWARKFWHWAQANRAFQEHILDTLRQRGPLAPEEIEDRAAVPWQSGGWSTSRNVSMMLEMLWEQGKVLVANRKGTRRFWDAAERVLPELATVERLEPPEVTRRAALVALRALGVATERQIQAHFTRGRYPGLRQVLEELVREGTLLEAVVLGEQGAPLKGRWYIHAADAALLEGLGQDDWVPRTVLLSPFDNLICDRARTEVLFGYEFRVEIYVPPAKRKYGYYVLSVLEGERFIGRIDPKMERKSGRLVLNAVHAEPGVEVNGQTGRAVAGAVEELARFLGAREVVLQGAAPEGWRRALSF